MLKKILSPKTCAECRICCCFDRYDVWETPVLTPAVADEIYHISPETAMRKNGEIYNFKVKELKGDELFYCPMLDKKKGCILGDGKPFDCKIWPYRIMEFNGKKVVTISPVCPELYTRPLKELEEFMKEDLLNSIKKYAEMYPEAVKPYDSMYPILYVIG